MRKQSLLVRGGYIAILVLALALPVFAETKSLLLLHTNDLHARIRPGHDALGGMPYVSGYIHQVREQRQDVLVLDGGDVTEKGDMVSFMTHNSIMYEAMNEAGHDVAVPGNHDMRDPLYLEGAVKAAPKISFVCMNCFRQNFEPSKVFTVNSVRVAVIGLTVKSGDDANTTLNDEECMNRLVKEVDRIEPVSDLQVILCHLGSETCLKISKRVPAVDIFVSGHTHELLEKPIHTDSGALIVQAGEYAQHVGRVDLQIDLDARQVKQADVSLVKMDHKMIPCDAKVMALIEERTKAVCPEANRVVAHSDEAVNAITFGRLAAEALRRSAQTDIGLFNAPYIFRADLPAGDITVADLFLSGGFRGYKIIKMTLTGKDIEAYITPQFKDKQIVVSWDGFNAKLERALVNWKVNSSLDPQKHYSVAIPELEWQKRYPHESNGSGMKKAEPCSFSFTDSVAGYITANIPKETSLNAYLKSMPKNGCEIQ
ncbi:MAG TPA: 5'-nucleotidase C-terminal domain-containing protein [Candidatus Hydrogenedentes bacterium]|nr:5'-nucleotidase C-terminal domain-containing protein [Candidatus Hydrogenedentota bacterium]